MKQHNATYQRLGDYIREVDVRNKDLKVTTLLGVSISKEFMPSIANTIGTDMSAYKVVKAKQFVYISDTSRRGDKIAIALLETEDVAIISQAYSVFEIIDTRQLLPEYLMMWFRRPEFDRYARFKSHGSAREVFSWEEMCDVCLPIPPIARQREIVSEYKMLTDRIRLNNSIISTLESTAQALYRKMFVDNIDKAHLPTGWLHNICIDDVLDFKYGTTLSSALIQQYGKYPVYGANGIMGYYNKANCSEYVGLITSRGNGSGDVSRTKHKFSFVTNNSFIVTSKKDYSYCKHPYIYWLLLHLDFKSICTGSAQPQLTNASIHILTIDLPPRPLIERFSEECGKIMEYIDLKETEINTLIKFQSLLLSKMEQ